MYEMADYDFIRYQKFRLGASIRQINRDYGFTRQTIRNALASSERPKYRLTVTKGNPVMDPYIPIIKEWIISDRESSPKQRHNASRIYERLVEEFNFTGGQSTVRRHVRKIKEELNQIKPTGYIPQEFPPGEYAQFDWGEVDVLLNGKKVTLQLFCMRLCHSRKIFVKVFLHQKQEALFQGHVDAFEYFGCVPKSISYDNLRTAVKKILNGKDRVEQDRFIQLRTHYLFQSHFNEPAKGNQKGQVEKLVQYTRQHFFVPLPSVTSIDELNEMLREKCDQYENRQVPQSSLTVKDSFEKEKPLLLPLPSYPFSCHREVFVSSNSLSQVTFETNRYSVPCQYEGRKNLLIKAFVSHIEIYEKEVLLARHHRSYDHHQEIFDFDHYLDLLEIRPGDAPYARPLIYANLPPIFREFERRLVCSSHGCREYIELLKLLRKYKKEQVVAALYEASSKQLFSLETVQQILYRLNEEIPILVPFKEIEHAHIPQVRVQKPSLTQFNQLLQLTREMVH